MDDATRLALWLGDFQGLQVRTHKAEPEPDVDRG
jgi:hypothetical protein